MSCADDFVIWSFEAECVAIGTGHWSDCSDRFVTDGEGDTDDSLKDPVYTILVHKWVSRTATSSNTGHGAAEVAGGPTLGL